MLSCEMVKGCVVFWMLQAYAEVPYLFVKDILGTYLYFCTLKGIKVGCVFVSDLLVRVCRVYLKGAKNLHVGTCEIQSLQYWN